MERSTNGNGEFDEDNFRIRQTVLKALFHIQADTSERLDAAFAAFDEAPYLLFKSTLLPIMGIGMDSFFLNEELADTTTILDFETLAMRLTTTVCRVQWRGRARRPGVEKVAATPCLVT